MPFSHSSRVSRFAATLLLYGACSVACARSDAATAGSPASDDDHGARVDGDHLIFKPNDPRIAALSTTVVTVAGSDSLRVPGKVMWNEDATVRVFSPFAGRVIRVVATVGQRVRPGETLALIASPDFGQAEADARRAATDVALAIRTADRVRDLLQHGVAAQKDLDAAEAELARARAEHDRTRARLAMYGADTSAANQAFPLRSPLGGIVVDRAVTTGQEVRPDQMLANAPQLFAPLFVVTDPSRLWVVLDVPERDAALVSNGAAVSISANATPDRIIMGRISYVSGSIDPGTRTLKVRGTVANTSGLLKAEMLVTVTLASPHVGGVSVPAAAILLENGAHVAYVDEGMGKLQRVPVSIGSEQHGMMRVHGGLVPGQRVVTNGALLFEQLFQQSRRHS